MGLAGPGRKPTKKAQAAVAARHDTHPWDAEGLTRAEKVIRFVETLPCTSGPLAGTPFRLRPWQRQFIRVIYATSRDGRRRVRTAVLSMGRGNGKTTLAAALALAHLAGPEAEMRGEIVSAANDRLQSRIFNELSAMIQRVPWLDERLSVRRFTKEIEDIGGTGSTYAALSADVGTKHGLAASMVIYDELGQAKGRELLDALDTSMGKRGEPLMLVISTQAARDEHPLSGLIDYGLRCQRGEIADPSFHLTLYSAPEDADPWVRETWKLANPALADFRNLKDIERLALQAQRMPAAEASFRNTCLNQRVDTTAQFLTAAAWAACGEQLTQLGQLKGRTCFAGLDLGATRDLTALVLVFADNDGCYDVVPYCWLPGETLQEREDADRMPYKLWAKQGHLLTFAGKTTDPGVVARKVAELHGQFDIKALAYDRWRIEDIKRELDAIGCAVPLTAFGQGFRDLSPAVDTLEKLVVDGKIRHGNHPVLTMCASNCKVEVDAAGNRKPSKKKSSGRIDALVALCMALGVATRHEVEEPWAPFLAVV